MNNFKFTPKLALAIILTVIFITGVVLLVRTTNESKKTTNINDKGLMSFFGERKTKPLDETTVAGANDNTGNTNNDGNNSDGANDTNDGSNNNTGNNGASGSGSGSLSLKSIGSNANGGAGSSGSGGSGISGNTSGGQTSGSGGIGGTTYTGGNTGSGYKIIDPGNLPENVIQLNCTPKQIEFTEEEQKKLKILEQRFYKIAAEIRTQQDVDTLVQTRQNYYDYLSSDYRTDSRKDGTGVVELTKQCFAEREKVLTAPKPPAIAIALQTTATPDGTIITGIDGVIKGDLDSGLAWTIEDSFYGKPLGMRLSPFLPKAMIDELLKKGPVKDYLDREKALLVKAISDADTALYVNPAEVTKLKNEKLALIKKFGSDHFTFVKMCDNCTDGSAVAGGEDARYARFLKITPPYPTDNRTFSYFVNSIEYGFKLNNISTIESDQKNINELSNKIAILESGLVDSSDLKNRLLVLLNQAKTDPFSYLANSTTFVGSEMYGEKETEQSRKNTIYYTVREMFFNAFTWNDGPAILQKMWGGDRTGTLIDEYNNASDNNPLKKEKFGNPCTLYHFNGTPKWNGNFYTCNEKYYPLQDLERVLGIW